MPGLNVTEQDMVTNKLFSHRCLFFNSIPSKPWCIIPCKHGYIGYISVMLALFPDPSLCPSWQRVIKEGIIRGEQDWRLPVPVCGQVKTTSLYSNFKISLCAATSYVTSLLKLVSSLHCMYNMHNSRTHPCMQPCKQGEWVNEYTLILFGSPLGFEWYSQNLDVSLKMLNDFYTYIVSCVHCSASILISLPV